MAGTYHKLMQVYALVNWPFPEQKPGSSFPDFCGLVSYHSYTILLMQNLSTKVLNHLKNNDA